ncbi:hypothetical protein EDB85DRAFT_1892741 [Lactarius pseudohatsudake]|nr:hypothetical protein EDB85DRAFT_1892741 [Lactarius pseudohatsudake]
MRSPRHHLARRGLMLSGYPASCDRAGSDPSCSQSPQPPRQQSHRFSPGSSPCAIIDAFWQTEMGNIIVTPFPGAIETKPTLPLFGMTLLSSTHHMKGIAALDATAPGPEPALSAKCCGLNPVSNSASKHSCAFVVGSLKSLVHKCSISSADPRLARPNPDEVLPAPAPFPHAGGTLGHLSPLHRGYVTPAPLAQPPHPSMLGRGGTVRPLPSPLCPGYANPTQPRFIRPAPPSPSMPGGRRRDSATANPCTRETPPVPLPFMPMLRFYGDKRMRTRGGAHGMKGDAARAANIGWVVHHSVVPRVREERNDDNINCPHITSGYTRAIRITWKL